VSLIRRILVALAAALCTTTAIADETCRPDRDPVQQALGCTSNPCVVESNEGGSIPIFEAALQELRRRDWIVIVLKYCASSCALLADKGRNRVFMTPETILGFHFAKEMHSQDVSCIGGKAIIRKGAVPLRLYVPPHSEDVLRMIRSFHFGQFPEEWRIQASRLGFWQMYRPRYAADTRQ